MVIIPLASGQSSGAELRKIDGLSTDAVAVLLYVRRQRARLQQHISAQEIGDALEYGAERLHNALFECEKGGWLLAVTEHGQRHYSMMAGNRRLIRNLGTRLN